MLPKQTIELLTSSQWFIINHSMLPYILGFTVLFVCHTLRQPQFWQLQRAIPVSSSFICETHILLYLSGSTGIVTLSNKIKYVPVAVVKLYNISALQIAIVGVWKGIQDVC